MDATACGTEIAVRTVNSPVRKNGLQPRSKNLGLIVVHKRVNASQQYSGGNADESLKEGIVSGEVGIVEIEVSDEELIDLLPEDLPGGVDDALLIEGIGKSLSEVVEDA